MNGEEQRLVLQRIVHGLDSMARSKCFYDEILIITTSYYLEVLGTLPELLDRFEISSLESLDLWKRLRLFSVFLELWFGMKTWVAIYSELGGGRDGFGEGKIVISHVNI